MSNSNEKLVAGIVALLPIARDALSNGHLNRQFDAVFSNNKVRHTGTQMASQAEKYIRDTLNNNGFTRKLMAQMKPKPSPLPAIALALVGAGIFWAYLERRKTRIVDVTEPDPIQSLKGKKSKSSRSDVPNDGEVMAAV